MAGVKGRSGGARPNSGGKRPGAGRKPGKKGPAVLPIDEGEALKALVEGDSHNPAPVEAPASPGEAPKQTEAAGLDMLQLLQAVALGKVEATALQVRAAIAAVQYTHTKRGDGGKKEEVADKAKKAASGGRFTSAAPPRLVAAGGQKV
jgi:phage terminase small subunit